MARLIILCAAGAVLSGAALVRAEPLGCLIQPFQEADVGAQVVGVLDQVMVERGDFVKKGQPLAQLNSDVERAAVASAKVRAESYAELQAAASNHDFAQKKRIRTQDLYQKNFVSQQVKDQASTEAEVAEMRLRQARESQRQAKHELALANAQMNQRTIRSPLSGVVVEKYLSEGERVEEKAVVKVATIDPLRVEVIVPSTHFSRIKTGMVATVKPDKMRGLKLLILRPLTANLDVEGEPFVATDASAQASTGDLVTYESSREAALLHDPWFVPVDHAVVEIGRAHV